MFLSSLFKEKNNLIGLRLGVLALVMFGFGYILVPIYDLICDVTGLNGKVALTTSEYNPANQIVDYSRLINTRFVTVYNETMPWELIASENNVKIHPGKIYQIDYTITNHSNTAMVAQAIPSVSPSNAADNFRKVYCFCFDNMHLASGESMNTSIVFFLDHDVEDTLHDLTLSYTLFDVSQHTL